MTTSYHYKYPRALDSKFRQQTEGAYAKYLLFYLDVEDKNHQFVEVQKLALQHGYNLLPADSVEDCRECLEELRSEYTGESRPFRKPERPNRSEAETSQAEPTSKGHSQISSQRSFYPKDRPEDRKE